MPINRHALIRLKTIDKCLQNRRRRWTIDDLITACSDALYEYEGTDKDVSMRTIRNDIALMRSDKLGYNAPIEIYDKKYYRYEDPEYSITNIPLSSQDMDTLTEVVEILKQFKGFSHFNDLTSVISKLEDKVYTERTHQAAIIDFEKNEQLMGLEHLDTLYQAVQNRLAMEMEYQSFHAKAPSLLHLNAWLLKEFRNRWFVVGTVGRKQNIVTFALDRIKSLQIRRDWVYHKDETFDPRHYYQDIVGVTVNNTRPQPVKLWVDKSSAPYVLSKPFHHSQKLETKLDDGAIIISLFVRHNFELERDILGFGETIEVLSPRFLRRKINYRLHAAAKRYEVEEQDENPSPKPAI